MTMPIDKHRQLVIAIVFCLAMVVLRWDWIQQQVNQDGQDARVNAPADTSADDPGAAGQPSDRGPTDDGASSTPQPRQDNGDSVESPARPAVQSGSTASTADQKFKLVLVEKNVQESPAGLRYGPGSREGHRLKHVLLHSRDQPDRPGAHGVFDGGEDQTLRVIDEAYQIALKRGPPVQVEQQGKRTVYTVDMQRRVGYVGGQQGQREGHPEATRVRLVLEGRDVITAFPLMQ